MDPAKWLKFDEETAPEIRAWQREIVDAVHVANAPELHLPSLSPAGPRRETATAQQRLAALTDAAGQSRPRSSPEFAALVAGLWQWHDDLDQSHRAAQSVEGEGRHRAGDYWHAIMHRREPDDSNAKYWFRRVGTHPVHEDLAAEARRILARSSSPKASAWSARLTSHSGWDAASFVDLCRDARDGDDRELEMAAREIQRSEMLLLLRSTWLDACGAF